jgi:hypothetical protein
MSECTEWSGWYLVLYVSVDRVLLPVVLRTLTLLYDRRSTGDTFVPAERDTHIHTQRQTQRQTQRDIDRGRVTYRHRQRDGRMSVVMNGT